MSNSFLKEQQTNSFFTISSERNVPYDTSTPQPTPTTFSELAAELPSSSKQIIAVGGGKGGVGKTVLTSALGIGLSSFDYNVIMVDADFGGANLHTCMGIVKPESNYYDFAFHSGTNLAEIAIDTQIQNLKIICGPSGVLGSANPKFFQKRKYIDQLKTLDADYIILDLGAGSTFNTLDFFLLADQGVLITTPDSAAINETFNFLKMCLMRRWVNAFKHNPEIFSILKNNFYAENGQIRKAFPELVDEIKLIDIEAYFQMQNFLNEYKPKLILNMVKHKNQLKEGNSFQFAAKELLGVDVEFIGYIEYDQDIRQASRRMTPFVLNYPNSHTAKSLSKIITNGLLKKNGFNSINHRKKIIKSIRKQSEFFKAQTAAENICSINCFYWENCEFRNGGYPCVLRKLDPIFQQ